MTQVVSWLLLAVVLCQILSGTLVRSKLVEITIGLFAEAADDGTISLLNESLTDDDITSMSGQNSIKYKMSLEITSQRYDTYSLTSSLCHVLTKQASVLFSLLPCEAIPSLVEVAARSSLPTLSWRHCLENPKSDWLAYMTSPLVTIQSAVRSVVRNLKWRRLVFIYDEEADPDLVGHMVEELREDDVIMIQMSYTDMAFRSRSDVWHVEENFLVYCSLTALNHTLEQSRINRLDFIGPHYKWLLLDPGTLRLSELLNYLVEGDNIAVVRPTTTSPVRQISSGIGLMKEILSNLTELGYEYSGFVCQSGRMPTIDHTNVMSTRINTELLSNHWQPFSVLTYVRLTSGKMGFKKIADVSNSGLLSLSEDIYPNLNRGYNGRTFFITTLEYEPFTMKTPDGQWTGIIFDLLDELATSMNFSYVINETRDEKFGIDIGNGSFNGVIGTIQRKEVDFALGPISVTTDRETVVDFTAPFWEDGYILLIRRPDPGESKMFICLGPFSELVWGIIIISLLVTSLVLWTSLNYSPVPRDRQPTRKDWRLLSFVTWQTFGALMQQGMVEEPVVTSARVIVSMWWFYVIVVAGVYNGNLIAFLTAPTTELPINSLQDLANSDMTFGTLRDAAFHGILEKATSGLYRDLWNKVRHNVDDLFYDDPDDALQRVLVDKDYVFVIEASYYTMLHIRNTTYRNMQCLFARPKNEFLTNMYALAFQKGSPYTSSFSMQLLRILESGLLQRIRRKWVSSGYRCTGLERVSSQTNISLREAQGAFYILGIGLVAATLILIAEMFAKYRRWSYRPGFSTRIRPDVGGATAAPSTPPIGALPPPSTSPEVTINQPTYGFDVEVGLRREETPGGDPDDNYADKKPDFYRSDTGKQDYNHLRHRNGFVSNGNVTASPKLIEGGLHYADILTGIITPSTLIYDVTAERRPHPPARARCKLSEPPARRSTDEQIVIRRRCNSCGAAKRIENHKRNLVNNNDAETGEVTVADRDLSYL